MGLKIIVLNKQKSSSIILIHGLFTNSGFWFRHLKLLKNFRLIIIDLDYQKLFRREIQIENINNQIFNAIKAKNDTVGIISHSFGTILSQNLDCLNKYSLYQICPIKNVISKNNIDFNNYILSNTKLTEEEIIETRLMASRFSKTTISRDNLHFNYIPIDDQHFEYPVTEKCLFFEGDHFRIEKAIAVIMNSIQ